MIKIGDKVETVNGVGIVDDIRRGHNEIIYLIRTLGSPALGCGYSDIYSRSEFEVINELS